MINITPEDLLQQTKSIYLYASVDEGIPEVLGSFDDTAEEVSRRSAAMQLEICSSIEQLLLAGHVRSAYSLLRTSLEIATSFAWMCKDHHNRMHKYNNGETPSIQKMMANLKWMDEYRKIYTPLSKFVHGDFRLSKIERFEYEIKSPNDSPESITATIYAQEKDGKINKMFYSDNLSAEELYKEHVPGIYLKLFDIAISMYIYASGEYSDSHSWFPKKEFVESVNYIMKKLSVNYENENYIWLDTKKILVVYNHEKWFQ